MTPSTCATFRRMAALLHAVPGLRATVWGNGRLVATITPSCCGGEPASAHPADHATSHPAEHHAPTPGMCNPCLFRRTVSSAAVHVELGDRIGVFGLPVGVDPTIELFTEDPCRLGPNGIVTWDLDDTSSVHCFATLLDVETAMAVAASSRNVRTPAPPEDTGRSDQIGLDVASFGRIATRVDFFHDTELEVSLVYAIVERDDTRSTDRATATLFDLMALFGAEEIALHPELMAVAG